MICSMQPDQPSPASVFGATPEFAVGVEPPHRPRRVRLQVGATVAVLAAGLATVLAVGIGGSSGTPVSNAQLLNLVHQASSAATRSPSTTFQMTETITALGHAVTIHMAGISTPDNHVSEFTLTAPNATTKALGIDHVVYERLPSAGLAANNGKPWVAVRSPRPTAQMRQLASSGPAGFLKALARVGGTIVNDGPATVHGIATTKYSFHVNLSSLVASLIDKMYPQATTQMFNSLGFNHLPVALWVDHTGLPREMALKLNFRGVSVSEVSYFEPSSQVPDISAPPAAEVNRVSSLRQFARVLRLAYGEAAGSIGA